jgi:4-amino-4-deoxy-L-arabinose transferase-like glycosyltransferase
MLGRWVPETQWASEEIGMPETSESRLKRWIFVSIGLFYLLRLFMISYLELAPDEAYYWYWGKHPALSYLDHPPMASYIMSLFTALGGDTEFFVRIGGLLLTVMALFLLYGTVRVLFPDSKRTAWETVFLCNITILFSAACIIQTPDTPMLLFWMAALYCSSKLLAGGAGLWWYLWGVSLGLGLLSKYTVILIVPCFFAFLLFSRPHRQWLLRKEPYFALLIGCLIFLPVLIWNWRHEWLSFAFQLRQGLAPNTRSAVSKLLDYVGGQAGIITPLFFVGFVYYSIKGWQFFRRDKRHTYFYLIMLSWPVVVFFGLTTIRGDVAEANWPGPAYLAGLILFAGVFHEHFREKKGHRRFVLAAAGLCLLLNLVFHAHLVKPIIPVPPKEDITQQFRDWRGLGKKIIEVIQAYPHKEGYFIVGDKGTTVAEAVFYSGAKYLGVDFDRPERYTFLGSLKPLRGKNAVIVVHASRDAAIQKYAPYFEKVEFFGRRPFIYRGVEIESLSVNLLVGKGYRGNWLSYDERRGG